MIDRFSNHAKQYAAFRPTYPEKLFEFIYSQLTSTQIAWDAGCGNGQVARELARRFEKVEATDISERQIENATKASNISYSLSPAEKTSFADGSFDLITVGQALHWFNIPAFYNEVRRVARPDAVLAVWGYSLLSIHPQMDPLVQEFYKYEVGPYWDKERRLVDERYQTIPFPFQEIEAPAFQFSFRWTVEELAGYLSTWSSVQKFIQAHHHNPVDDLMIRLKPLWVQEKYEVTFPLFVRMGKIK